MRKLKPGRVLEQVEGRLVELGPLQAGGVTVPQCPGAADHAADVVGLVEDLVAGDLDRQALARAAEAGFALGLLAVQRVRGQVHQHHRRRLRVDTREQRRDALIGLLRRGRPGQDHAHGTQRRLAGQKPPRPPVHPASQDRRHHDPQARSQPPEEPLLVLEDRIPEARSAVQRRQHLDIQLAGMQPQQDVRPG